MNLVPFGSICKLQNGRAFKPSEWSVSGTPIVRIQNLNDESKPFNYCSFEVEERFKIKSGDLLFSWSGTPGTSFGAFFWNRGKGFLNQHIFRVDTDESAIDKNYLRYAINSKLNFIIDQAHGGVGLKHITKGKLEEILIPLPSLEDQTRIAAILDKADALRRKRQQAIQLADIFLGAVFLDIFGNPVTNPKGWHSGSLSEFGSFKNGLNYSKGETGDSVHYLGVGDFKSLARIDGVDSLGSIELNSLPSEEYFLKDGDILFVRSNGNKALVGRCISVHPGAEKVTFSGFCIRYRIENPALTSSYLNFLFRTPSAKRAMLQSGQGANIQNINQKILSSIEIPIPPIELQNKFSRIATAFEKSKLSESSAISQSVSLFNSLSQKAFAGNL